MSGGNETTTTTTTPPPPPSNNGNVTICVPGLGFLVGPNCVLTSLFLGLFLVTLIALCITFTALICRRKGKCSLKHIKASQSSGELITVLTAESAISIHRNPEEFTDELTRVDSRELRRLQYPTPSMPKASFEEEIEHEYNYPEIREIQSDPDYEAIYESMIGYDRQAARFTNCFSDHCYVNVDVHEYAESDDNESLYLTPLKLNEISPNQDIQELADLTDNYTPPTDPNYNNVTPDDHDRKIMDSIPMEKWVKRLSHGYVRVKPQSSYQLTTPKDQIKRQQLEDSVKRLLELKTSDKHFPLAETQESKNSMIGPTEAQSPQINNGVNLLAQTNSRIKPPVPKKNHMGPPAIILRYPF